ncbi:MAG: inorganic phosphate transporter [Deltaproteobacteria bacterium]|nr:inorganic phosphate transporter [Deltaproteobacteria bacterium]
MLTLVIIVIVLALIFDFVNGMNDAANSIATVVSTRVLPPWLAVAWAAFFNFAAAILFGVAVAKTIGKGIVDPAIITPWLVLAALVGAIVWSAGCTEFGLPISVSHSLIGGLAGAGVAHSGTQVLVGSGLLKVVLFIVLSPLIGLVLGYLLMIAMFWIFRRSTPRRVDRIFRVGQLVSSAAFSLGHGSNDAQKTMGIITVLLFSTGHIDHFYVPLWVILAAYSAIALGTLAGGWRVIRTMGMGLTALKPVGGFCAETGGAASLFLASILGVPVSTTHTITGAILGVGSTVNASAVRWGVAGRIVWAWILTIPCSAFIAGTVIWIFDLCGAGA